MRMKKFILILGLFLALSANARAEEDQKDNVLVRIQQETEKYKKECYDKEAFPKGIDNYSMYNDDIKDGDYRYHQCLKKIIIKEIATPKYAKRNDC